MKPPIEVLSVTMAHATSHVAFDSIIARNPSFLDSPPGDLSVYASTHYSLFYFSDCEDFPVRVNNTIFSYQKKHLYLFPPYVPHSPSNSHNGATSGLDMKFLIADKLIADKICGVPMFAPCDDKMFDILSQIKKITLDDPQKEKLNELAHRLLVLFLDSKARRSIESDEQSESSMGFPKLIKHLYEHYNEDLSLSDMAKVMHMDKAHFAKKFKAMYNITPINYLYSLRLTLSFDALIHTNRSIAQIAEDVGFKNVSAYCTAFRRAYGVSPGEYRERAKVKQFSKNKDFIL